MRKLRSFRDGNQKAIWIVVGGMQVLVAVPAVFHVVRVSLGYSMAEAINGGWLLASEVCPLPCWKNYRASSSITNRVYLAALGGSSSVPDPLCCLRDAYVILRFKISCPRWKTIRRMLFHVYRVAINHFGGFMSCTIGSSKARFLT